MPSCLRPSGAPSRRALKATFSFAFCVISLFAFVPAGHAQTEVYIPEEALSGQGSQGLGELQALITEGEQLERQGRWGEALSHYEDAVRAHPTRGDLKNRLTRSRLRYDLARRYSDSSFLRSIESLSERQSLDMYSEVLEKIDTYYVSNPSWETTVANGTYAFNQALSDETFLKKHATQIDSGRIGKFRNELQRYLGWQTIRTKADARKAVHTAAQLAELRLGVPSAAVVMEYTAGATRTLDNYSAFLTQDQLDDVYSQIEGNFVGLGIELKAEDDSLLMVSVIPGSPAEEAGIQAGDRFLTIDGHSLKEISTDKGADMLRGPEGSTVLLTVASPNQQPRQIRVIRRRVEVPSVDQIKIVDKQHGIAYLRITSFQKTTVRDLDAALWKLHRDGMRSLIVDVRDNPGGLLTASVEAADKFVQQGTLVSTRGRSPREDYDYKAHRVGTWRVPLLVLIDGNSASAAEIFAGAVRDHGRAIIVGERSYGKGSVQGIFPLGSAKTGVRLTTAKFYTPSGRAISNQGVLPTLEVQIRAKPVEGGLQNQEDQILAAGIEAAKQQLTQR